MAKDIVTVDGEEQVVREDTAKSYRGIIWALTSIGIFIAVLAVLLFTGALKNLFGGNLESPAEIEKTTRR